MKRLILVIALLIAGVTVIQAAGGYEEVEPVKVLEITDSDAIIVQGNNLTEKLDWLKAFVQSNGNYILEVNADESISAQRFQYSGKSSISITFKGAGANWTVRSTFTVGSGVILILENNITLLGNCAVESGGNLIINDGATITGHRDTYQTGGVNIKGGAFIMNGGEISGNGNGVYMNRGIFIFNNGKISGNSSFGVLAEFNGGTITMNDGEISGNRGGGVRIGNREITFTMNGGTISGNTITSTSSNPVYGGGVHCSAGTFTMNDGMILGNTASGGFGGGVYNSGTFTMNGGEISGNTATAGQYYNSGSGGGVYGYFTMNNGTISNNTAQENGGGVYVRGGTFSMNNGIISNNTAREYGGGVYVNYRGTFDKTGGILTGYTDNPDNGNVVKDSSGSIRNYRGHAVYAGSSDSIMKIKETSVRSGDDLSFESAGWGDEVWRYSHTFSGPWDN